MWLQMLSPRLLDELIMRVQQLQHAGFINPHLAAKAHDSSEHDGRQLTSLSGDCPADVLWHEGDYRARGLRLSNRAHLAFSLP